MTVCTWLSHPWSCPCLWPSVWELCVLCHPQTKPCSRTAHCRGKSMRGVWCEMLKTPFPFSTHPLLLPSLRLVAATISPHLLGLIFLTVHCHPDVNVSRVGVCVCLVPYCIRSTASWVVLARVGHGQLFLRIDRLTERTQWHSAALPSSQVLWDRNGVSWHYQYTFSEGGRTGSWMALSVQCVVIYCYSHFSVAVIKYLNQNQLRGLFDSCFEAQPITKGS